MNKITDLIANIAPWIAPVPTAFLIYRSSIKYLEWPWYIALVAALVIEFVGLSVTNQALILYDYNRGKRKTDPAAPLWLAVILVILYVGVALVLTVLLDTIPGLSRYAPAIFPLLSLVGITVLALRSDHVHRLFTVEQMRQERKQARLQAVKPSVQIVNPGLQLVDTREQNLLTESTPVNITEQIEYIREREPGITFTAIAQRLDISRTTLYKRLREKEPVQ